MEQETAPTSWHFDAPITTLPAFSDYQLVAATDSDIALVMRAYQMAPVPSYDLAKVEVIYNPTLNERFAAQLKLLQGRQNNPAFFPRWEQEVEDSEEERIWRQFIYTQWKAATAPYTDTNFPAVHLSLLWHGARKDTLNSLFSVGYAALGLTDSGFFGRGIYSTGEATYAHRVYGDGALVVNWIAAFSAYPVIYADRPRNELGRRGECKLEGKGNYQNYDAHWILVVPAHPGAPSEVNYDATKPHQPAVFTEYVVFESAQCLPRYLVTLQPGGLETRRLSYKPVVVNITTAEMEFKLSAAYYAKGHSDEFNANVKVALTDFLEAAKLGYPPAYIRVLDCVESWGLTAQSEFYQDKAGNCFDWFRTHARQEVTPDGLHWPALYGLGRCYELGWGAEKDAVTAVQCYQEGALKHHDILARYRLAWCYEHGIGVKQEPHKAIKQYTLCAQKGYAPALSQLGFCYQMGIGTPASDAQAFFAYQQAADKGHAGAQVNLALFYEKGILVQKNIPTAIAYYQKAASQGKVNAQLILAEFYKEGTGVTRDLQQAKYYYQLALDQGDSLAQVQLEELNMQLSQAEESIFRVASHSQTHSLVSTESAVKKRVVPACRLQ